MLADELRRSQPHEVHPRGARPADPPPPRDEDRDRQAGSARTVHRLRRIRQVSVEAITEIDQALRHRAS
ncbi:hypothetical protein [Nonomuraea candida]|uniref:hypothetical protein n=1 Tax=Nonomuraea candida TaxID=359159 RepID=UPI0005BBB5D1|nr:hypothetical protein [Nonomuraea candida]